MKDCVHLPYSLWTNWLQAGPFGLLINLSVGASEWQAREFFKGSLGKVDSPFHSGELSKRGDSVQAIWRNSRSSRVVHRDVQSPGCPVFRLWSHFFVWRLSTGLSTAIIQHCCSKTEQPEYINRGPGKPVTYSGKTGKIYSKVLTVVTLKCCNYGQLCDFIKNVFIEI